MKKLFIYLFLIIFSSAFSQDLVIDWDECFGGPNDSSDPEAIEVLLNNSIILTLPVIGNNEAFTNYHDGVEAWVLVLDSTGNILQEKCFGGSEIDHFLDIEVFEDHIYLAGYTTSFDGDVQSEPVGGYVDLWVVKTDYDLNIIWEKRYGSLGVQQLATAKVTAEGGLVLLMDFFQQGGGDVSQYYGNTDIWVCEIDADGEILWEKTLGNAWGNYSKNVMQTEDGKTIVLGEINFAGEMVDCYCHSTDGTYEIWVVALDNTGEILWQNCYGGTKWEAGFDIIAENNGYTFLGQTESTDGDVSFNNGDFDLWLVHIDSIGNLIWEESYGGSDADIGRQIYKTEENGYILLGATVSNDGDVNHSNCTQSQVYCQTNTWVVELDSNRNIIWNKTYGSSTWSSYHTRNAAKRIGERDFIIAGLIEDTDIHSGDVDCEPYPINNGKSAWIYRLHSPDTGTFIHNLAVKELRVYPNPAHNQVTFELPQIKKENTLQIKDIFGRTIVELLLITGQTQLIWDCSEFSNGVYFYQTEIGGEVYRGKIVVQD